MKLHPAAFEFLKAINDHNTRKFFATVRPLYDEIQENLKQVCTEIIKEVSKFDPDVKDLQPKDCMFRVYRDARRLKEGDQIYKNNRGMAIGPGGKNSSIAGYYLHLQPGNQSFFGGGVYWPQPSELRNLRHYLSKYGKQYESIVKGRAFASYFGKVHGETLSRPPQGFKDYTPFLDLVKRKQHLIYAKLTDKDVLQGDIVDIFVEHAKVAYDWMHFLRTGSETSAK